jgi:integrase
MRSEARVYVRERSPGKFELRSYLGVKSDGTPRFKYETHTGDGRSAKARGREIEAAMLRGEVEGLSADTFGGFCDRYLARIEAEGDLALSTTRGYRTCRERIPAKLNKRQLVTLRPRDFELLYADLIKRLSPVTVTNTHRFFRLVLEYATDMNEIEKNPCSKVRVPKGTTKKRREVSFDDDFDFDEDDAAVQTIPRADVFRIVESFENPPGQCHANPMTHALFFTAYATGMRRGEILALTWRDIDFEAGKLHVRRAIYWPHGVEKPIVKEPKTSSGRRTITISPATVRKLREWRTRLEAIAKEARAPVPKLVFPNLDTFGPFRPDTASNAFRTRALALGIKGNLHALRHTHASELLAAREPVHVVSKRLGHADIAITLRIYAHALPGSDESVASRIDEVLGL